MTETAQPQHLPGALRSTMSLHPDAVVVITVGGDTPHAMTANTLTCVSLEPPKVLVCVDRAARIHPLLQKENSFTVSILGADQIEVADHFASSSRELGPAQFEGVAHFREDTVGPVIDGALGWLDCSVEQIHPEGDHSIFHARVTRSMHDPKRRDGLSYFRGEYVPVQPEAEAQLVQEVTSAIPVPDPLGDK